MSKSVEAALAELSEGGAAGGGAVPAVQVSQTGKLIVPSMPWNRLKFVMREVCPPAPSLLLCSAPPPPLGHPDPDPPLTPASHAFTHTDLPLPAFLASHSHSPLLTILHSPGDLRLVREQHVRQAGHRGHHRLLGLDQRAAQRLRDTETCVRLSLSFCAFSVLHLLLLRQNTSA